MSLYNGYVRCIKNPDNLYCLTDGWVYKVCNGGITLDSGYKVVYNLHSFEQLQRYSNATWEELELVKCDEYEVGDHVLVQNKRGITWNPDGEMDNYIGKICVISERISENLYRLNFDEWYFHTDDFVGKLIPKAAMVKSNHLKTKDWTNNEIKKARHIVTEYIKMLAMSRTTLVFYTSTKSIKCCLIKIQTNSSEIDVVRENTAFCKDNDIFNVDIGMCVAACKVLNKPIPDFILNK